MRVEVSGVDFGVSQVLRGKTVRAVVLAMSRVRRRVRKVTVRLTETANDPGGAGHSCSMRAWARGGGHVGVHAIAGDFDAAVARAASQLAERVEAGVARSRDRRTTGSRPPRGGGAG